MKIISQIPVNKYLISIDKDELARVLGYYYESAIPKDFIKDVISNETDIDMSDIYKKHYIIHDLQNSDNITKARKELERMLAALTPIEDKVKSLPISKKP